MIRINLLAVEREKPKRRAVALGAAQKLTIACSVVLLATAVGIVWWFWWLQQRDRQLDREIAAAEQEAARLREVLAQVQKFETQKAQLQQRVVLIEELRKGQGGAVHLLDEVSRALPDRLWLTQLRQDPKDGTTSIDGMATSLTALSDFVANLETSGYFKRPVEIVSSQVESQQGTELVRFTVRGTFAMPGVEAAPPARAPARGAPPGRRK